VVWPLCDVIVRLALPQWAADFNALSMTDGTTQDPVASSSSLHFSYILLYQLAVHQIHA